LLLKIDHRIYGFDTATGEAKMAFEVGSSHPPIAFGEDEIYLLLRRKEDPPLLYALDPDNGSIRWTALAPSGSLDITFDGQLLTRSVRAVRPVHPESDDDFNQDQR